MFSARPILTSSRTMLIIFGCLVGNVCAKAPLMVLKVMAF
jgi:hypothetical protein